MMAINRWASKLFYCPGGKGSDGVGDSARRDSCISGIDDQSSRTEDQANQNQIVFLSIK